MDMNKIGQMSCNPAVGGIAKGQIVREIDALGGHMGLVTDRTAIQFRLLNRSKGPAMWSPRAQCDRAKFIWAWREVLENTPHLHIWQDTVRRLLVEDGEVRGVETVWGVTFHARCVIVTAGTFLNGLMHVGRTMLPGGRMAEPAAYELTESIAAHGIAYGRMKTGTPVRIDGRSVHYEDMEVQDGEADFHKFSFLDTPTRQLRQLPCWTCYTNEEAHEVRATPTRKRTRCCAAACPIRPFSTGRSRASGRATAPASRRKSSPSPTSRNTNSSWSPKARPRRNST